MKNSEMKISELLKLKSQLEDQVSRTRKAIKCLETDFSKNGTIGVYGSNNEYRFSSTKDIMLKAANEMLDIQIKELEPVAKKLEAIELMLSGL